MKEVILNLVAAVIYTVAGVGCTLLWQWYFRRAFWGFGLPKRRSITIVVGTWGNPKTERGYSHLVITATDAVAAGNVAGAVRLAYGSKLQVNIKASEKFVPEMWNTILVVVGGKVRNEVTRELLRRLESSYVMPFVVHDEDKNVARRIVDTVTNVEFTAEQEGDTISKDWALICRLPNPVAEGSLPVYLLYGLHAFGTEGAGQLFFSEGFRGLLKELGSDDDEWFQMLVHVPVVDQEVFPEVKHKRAVRRKSATY